IRITRARPPTGIGQSPRSFSPVTTSSSGNGGSSAALHWGAGRPAIVPVLPNERADRKHRASSAAHGSAALPCEQSRTRALSGDRGNQTAHPDIRKNGHPAPKKRLTQDVHRAQGFLRNRSRANVSHPLAED